MNVENNGRRELAQWKVAMPVGNESHPPLLRTGLLVELLESPSLRSRGARQERCPGSSGGAIPAVPKWQLLRGGLAASDRNLRSVTSRPGLSAPLLDHLAGFRRPSLQPTTRFLPALRSARKRSPVDAHQICATRLSEEGAICPGGKHF